MKYTVLEKFAFIVFAIGVMLGTAGFLLLCGTFDAWQFETINEITAGLRSFIGGAAMVFGPAICWLGNRLYQELPRKRNYKSKK